jgi:nucleotide-binding universal stress UspA family protein
MLPGKRNYLYALEDFTNARRKASIQEILARISGRSSELLSYEEVAQKLKLNVRTELGVRDIPLKAIIGSVGRYSEFTRDFMPLKNIDRQRWARVKAAVDDPGSVGLPPIEVYKVGEAYFVLDGNHRVSVARSEGNQYISAHVIEVQTDISITPDIQPDDLIIKAEYADFLAQTDFANLRPGVDLSLSVAGQYEILLEHIQIHRYYMGLDFQREIQFPEAVGHWYDVVYVSIVEPVRERGLLRWFPGRTETDMYLWVSAYRANLERELGWSIRPEAAASKLAKQERTLRDPSGTGSWRLEKMIDRYTDRLFGDILVPITGVEESWQAVEQAILIAEKESSSLYGLHVIPPSSNLNEHDTQEIKERFNQSCQSAGLQGSLVVEKGNVSRLVCERALLSDLIVLNVTHPPIPGLSSLRSGLRSIIWSSARPILTVPGKASPMDNAMLAFDGSATSKEALFVATYLAEKWQTKLTVLTIADADVQSIQDYARTYLELHEIYANYLEYSGSFEIFLKAIVELQINLIVSGSYSGTPLKEFIAGSAVNYLLNKADCAMLICR